MKKTQWIELFHSIRQTMVSFIAIVIFVALAAGLFTGIRWTGNALNASIEADYADGHFHHFTISYPYGFDNEFIASLTKEGIVDNAEGYYETYRYLLHENTRYQVKLSSLTEQTDRPVLVSGSLPEKAGEAAVNVYFARSHSIGIGDEICLEPEDAQASALISSLLNGKPGDLLSSSGQKSSTVTDSFLVTALVDAPAYMGKFADSNGYSPNSPGPVVTVIYTAEASFNQEVFCGCPMLAAESYRLSGLSTSSEEYESLSGELKACLEEKADAYTAEKNETVVSSAEKAAELLKSFSKGADTETLLCSLENVAGYDAFVSTRQMNVSFAGVSSVMDTFEKMQYSLVMLFVVIGVLVCYSTVSRLVYDRTALIGTKKALGFSSREIVMPFLIYAAFAVLFGAAAGVLTGRFLIEPVMVSSVRASYRFRNTVFYFGIKDSLLFFLLQLVLMLLTALFASVSVCRQKALKLLSGEQLIPASNHRWLDRLPFFGRLSLLNKTIVKNCLNDRRRVSATLIGVMGCTALVVCALSMYNNLTGSLKRNMKKITTFDTILYFEGGAEEAEQLSALIGEAKGRCAPLLCRPGAMNTSGGKQTVTELFVTDNEAFYELFRLYDISDGTKRQAENGAWVNIAYAENNDAAAGDTLRFTDASGQCRELLIEGIFDYYLMNYRIIMTKDLYEEKYGEAYEPNAFFLNTDGIDTDSLKKALLDLDKNLVFSDFRGGNERLFESIAGIARAVSAVYLLLSAVLSVLLLLNLFTMFIGEKKKELITLMINGFTRKEAERYIYADARLLTVLGILGGLVLGVVMGRFSLNSFNNASTHFLNRVDPAACAAGIVFTAGLTYLMCRIALKKVGHFSLTDINS